VYLRQLLVREGRYLGACLGSNLFFLVSYGNCTLGIQFGCVHPTLARVEGIPEGSRVSDTSATG